MIDKATEIRCLLLDGRHLEAEVLGEDKNTDLALLQLSLEKDAASVPFAQVGDSKRLKEGDFVMAMGAPWGLSRSVSIGIISCTRRYLPDHSEYSLWLQTDASISPGNSGGPLVNTDGEIIGINSLGIGGGGGDIGFAIPSQVVSEIVSQIRRNGKVDWNWTGLRLQALKDFNRSIYFNASEGVVVAGTDPESPARRAGLQARDRILRINDRRVDGLTEEDLPDIRRILGVLPKRKPVTLSLVRGDKDMTLELVPRAKGSVEGEELDCPRWNLTVKTINQFGNPNLYFHRKTGVFIFGLKYPGNAVNAKFMQGDIILKIGKEKVETLEEVKAAYDKLVANVEKQHRVVWTVLRNGLLHQAVLDFARDYEKE